MKEKILNLIRFVEQAMARDEAEYEAFFVFYEAITRASSPKVALEIGRIPVNVKDENREEKKWFIELTAADYVWWRDKVKAGVRFKKRPASVKTDIVGAFARKAEDISTTIDEKNSLLDLLKIDV